MDIYLLKDPVDQSVRYVGITRQPLKERLRLHIKSARYRKRDHQYLSAKDKWILNLIAIDKKPIILSVASELSENEAVMWEFSHSRDDAPVFFNKSTLNTQSNSPCAHPIYGVKNDVKIQFGSIMEAVEFTGISYQRLWRGLKLGHSVDGYCWYYSKK